VGAGSRDPVSDLAAQPEHEAAVTRGDDEHGSATLLAIAAMLLVGVLGAALILVSSTEIIIAASFRSGIEARDAAAAMMARGLDEVAGAADWTGPIAGTVVSTLNDGVVGVRVLTDGSPVDLPQVVNLANCAQTTNCTATDRAAVTRDRPWGTNNPNWRLYAYGPLASALPSATVVDSPYYVALLVADDPSASHRAAAGDWEGLSLRAESFGPRAAHAVVEVTVRRNVNSGADQTEYNSGLEQPPMTVLSWREVR
jgi:hypothetical protein